MARVAIVQPWLPQYRVPFYERLRKIALDSGVEVDIYYGDPPPEWKERGDTVSVPWATRLPTRALVIAGRSLMVKRTSALRSGRYDLLILEQAVRNLETYWLVATTRRKNLAFWGHGRTYTERRSRAQETIKQRLTQRGSWFFSYTEGGRNFVSAAGFPADRVTVVQNTVDTTGLRRDLGSITDGEIASFRRTHRIGRHVGLHLGGLDESKRVPMLLDVAAAMHRSDPDFTLLVVGAGSDSQLIQAAAGSLSYVRYLGPLFGRDKALALASADVLLNPGRVGLIAVDSFVSGTPIITTAWDRHAPEFEYLQHGRTAVVAEDDSTAVASAALALLRSDAQLNAMREACTRESDQFSIETMAGRFLDGIESALANEDE